MTVRRIVPDIRTDRIEANRDFYTDLVGLEIAMDLGWVVTLCSSENETAQLTLLTHDQTASLDPDMTIEVEDVDAVHDRARQRGHKVLHPLTDEPWGVRRFFVEDPDGRVVNVVSHSPRPKR